tara:strand:- start:161 stop:805 length:645 start_codon:yes stop_codon:yes gene_type:complete
MISAIIVAGGSGSRFGGEIPKQFIKINNKRIIDYSIKKLKKNVSEIIIVCHKDWVQYIKDKYPSCKVVKGGSTRSESVCKGLLNLSSKSIDVLIHDAARPFIDESTIQNCIQKLKVYDCVAPIIDIKDSIVLNDNNNYGYISRDSIKIIQTPQCFKTNVIKFLYKSCPDSTDEISLALNSTKKYKIKFIKGMDQNIKITSRIDLEIAKTLLNQK